MVLLKPVRVQIYIEILKTMNEINEQDLNMEEVLSAQIPDYDNVKPVQSTPIKEEPVVERKPSGAELIGTKLNSRMAALGGYTDEMRESDKQFAERNKLTKVGERIGQNTEFRDGWMDIDKRLLGERAKFYPESWQFRIRPATVEAIRNWSVIDDENPNSIDDVFNEILKTCLSIVTPEGPLPWGNIRSWDRFFFLLLIREYTFVQGEAKVEFTEDCSNCDNDVTFKLLSTTLDYELPDPELMRYFSVEDQNWMIDPSEFEVNEEPIMLYLPTLEKDANIKTWIISRVQEKKKIDNIFIKFLPWLAPKISKDATIANRQIREYEAKYKGWDSEMFSLMDEVIRNISVTPATKLVGTCPVCGEEVTADIRFPDGVRSLFAIPRKRKKFGSK